MGWAVFINTLRPRENGRHFPDDIFKRILLFFIKISLNSVPQDPINIIPVRRQAIIWTNDGLL